MVGARARSVGRFSDPVVTHTGYLLGTGDAPLSASVTLKLRVFDQPTLGTLQWEGTCTGVAVQGGYYAVTLGDGTCPGSNASGLDPALDSADLPVGATRWFEVEVAGATLSPRAVLTPAPAATSATLLGTAPRRVTSRPSGTRTRSST